MGKSLIPNDYPELRLICWHRPSDQPMDEEEAFAIYERNWRYVDKELLSDAETALIERLKDTYGNGVING